MGACDCHLTVPSLGPLHMEGRHLRCHVKGDCALDTMSGDLRGSESLDEAVNGTLSVSA